MDIHSKFAPTAEFCLSRGGGGLGPKRETLMHNAYIKIKSFPNKKEISLFLLMKVQGTLDLVNDANDYFVCKNIKSIYKEG